MLRISLAEKSVRTFTIQRSGTRINFLFEGNSRRRLWTAVHSRLGLGLKRSCIVVAQGSKGWENRVLLHHFDPAVVME